MTGLSVKDYILAHGVSYYIVQNPKGSTRTVIGGLGFYDDFCLLHF